MEKSFSEVLNSCIYENLNEKLNENLNQHLNETFDDDYYNYLKMIEYDIYNVNKLIPNKCYICKSTIYNHNMIYCKKNYCNMNDSSKFYTFHKTFIKLLKDKKIN